jgi:hypothetical protein
MKQAEPQQARDEAHQFGWSFANGFQQKSTVPSSETPITRIISRIMNHKAIRVNPCNSCLKRLHVGDLVFRKWQDTLLRAQRFPNLL